MTIQANRNKPSDDDEAVISVDEVNRRDGTSMRVAVERWPGDTRVITVTPIGADGVPGEAHEYHVNEALRVGTAVVKAAHLASR